MDLTERIDAVVDGSIRNEKIVGAVTIVARDGEVVYRKADGLSVNHHGLARDERHRNDDLLIENGGVDDRVDPFRQVQGPPPEIGANATGGARPGQGWRCSLWGVLRRPRSWCRSRSRPPRWGS